MNRKYSPLAITVVWGITGVLAGQKLSGASDMSWWLVFILPLLGFGLAFLLVTAAIIVRLRGK